MINFRQIDKNTLRKEDYFPVVSVIKFALCTLHSDLVVRYYVNFS